MSAAEKIEKDHADKTLRIGCGAGFWGDSAAGPAQLVRRGGIDVLVLDYLAEITMSILARMRQKNPELGYATDFVEAVMLPLAKEIADRKIKVVANAGGVNPIACKEALERGLAKLGVTLRVAVVTGDDLMSPRADGAGPREIDALRAEGVLDSETGRPLPSAPLSANAYLGAQPIAEALRRGADVVITGRCVDSALALGPLLATFGWRTDELDRLAMGSLAGHVIECGAQATGGISTDWWEVEAGYADMGFPIVECSADGSFVVTKPAGTGGRVAPETVAEQIVYEVHDPARYVLPDVVCDFTQVKLEAVGEDRVRVTGARGLPPPPALKASVTYADGFRGATTLMIVGHDARAKAERVGRAILERVNRLNGERGLAPFPRTSVEVLGAETYFGEASRAKDTREVILAIAVAHPERAAVETFTREIAPAATAMVQSITGFAGGRPAVTPIVRLASCLVARDRVTPKVVVDGAAIDVPSAAPATSTEPARAITPTPATLPSAPTATREVPLRWVARARSGDKGNVANVGVLARRPELAAVLREVLTEDAVARWLAHLVKGRVTRHEWPGLDGFNFVLEDGLGGGGIASLRHDPQGKSMAQLLLEMPVRVPEALAVDPRAAG